MDELSSGGLITYINLGVWGICFGILILQFFRSIRVVPTAKAYIVERLGKYSRTLGPGFHALFPFLDRVAFIQDLREMSITVPPQVWFTKDNVQVEVDGVIYISVVDPVAASYGIDDYLVGTIQLGQTTTRSVIGTLELDRTFEERDIISSKIVEVLSEAGQLWGIRVHRYEIKNIVPPTTVKNAMEKQVTAERERRAIIATAEGEKESRISRSIGMKTELINLSEGEMTRRINEAEGKASEIQSIAEATADSIEKLADAITQQGGDDAVRLQLSQKFLTQLGYLANENTSVLFPADLTRLDELLNSLHLDDVKTG